MADPGGAGQRVRYGGDRTEFVTTAGPTVRDPSADARLRLGRAFRARVPAIVAQLAAEHESMNDELAAIFDEAAVVSTTAVAEWIAGGDLQQARQDGARTIRVFGQLAARQDVLLAEIVKRVLGWRDRLASTLRDEAGLIGSPPDALTESLAMLGKSADVTLVRLGDSFEAERQDLQHRLLHHQSVLAYQAAHDPLTGLANRTTILDRTEVALARAGRLGGEVAAVLIDLDNFKFVNDTYGHLTGDELLRSVAERIGGVARATDLVGRLGGDEFIVIAEQTHANRSHDVLASRLRAALDTAFDIGEGDHRTSIMITASLGLAVARSGAPEDLIRNADIAMYQAKSAGRDRHIHFEPHMAIRTQQRLELEQDLRIAVRERQFRVAYQPIFDLSDMRTVAVEALARWQRPDGRSIGADEFIPVLEQCGLIVPMGRIILEQACRDAAGWNKRGHPIKVAVNVSPLQLDCDAFVAEIPRVLAATGLPAQSLIVEITENALIGDAERAVGHLHRLRQLGVSISIDDFGTGYSSLDQLRDLPIDTAKIDRTFVDRMLSDSRGEALIATLLGVCRALSISTLAEGIETHEQLAHLQRQDCDLGQGYYHARPLPAHEVLAHLDQANPHEVSTRRTRSFATNYIETLDGSITRSQVAQPI